MSICVVRCCHAGLDGPRPHQASVTKHLPAFDLRVDRVAATELDSKSVKAYGSQRTTMHAPEGARPCSMKHLLGEYWTCAGSLHATALKADSRIEARRNSFDVISGMCSCTGWTNVNAAAVDSTAAESSMVFTPMLAQQQQPQLQLIAAYTTSEKSAFVSH